MSQRPGGRSPTRLKEFVQIFLLIPTAHYACCLSLKMQPLSYFCILYMFQLHFIELTMLLSASLTCLDACCCHGLRLPVFNKETT